MLIYPTIFVVVGDIYLKCMTQLVESGSTIRTTGSHLHYEIIRNGKTLIPCGFLELCSNKGCIIIKYFYLVLYIFI